MPSSVRTKVTGGNSRAPPVTPMSERQQMALLMQMTSTSNESGSRSPSSGTPRSRDRNERGETPLHLAAIKGDVDQVCKLLAHRADPNAADFAGWTPLHEACNHGWYEVACRLVQAGATVNARGLDNDTPLHDAVTNCHVRLVQYLVENGADIHAKNSKGKSPVDVAVPSIKPFLFNPNLPVVESGMSSKIQPRSRDDKKVTDSKQKSEEGIDGGAVLEDVYEFKTTKESVESPEQKTTENQEIEDDSLDRLSIPANQEETLTNKRAFTDLSEGCEDNTNDDESKRKKRKDESGKDNKSGVQRNATQNRGQVGKHVAGSQMKSSSTGKGGVMDKKSPCPSPKPASSSAGAGSTTGASSTSDAELEEGKTDLKVPPLKIVIPQAGGSGAGGEQEVSAGRNGKNSSQRVHPALPYVVASLADVLEKDSGAGGEKAGGSPQGDVGRGEDKKEKEINCGQIDEQRGGGAGHQRVLRSSHRTGGSTMGAGDRGSNNSSPQLQRSHSPSPTTSPAETLQSEVPAVSSAATAPTHKATDSQSGASPEVEVETASSASASNAPVNNPAPVDLHPRKRKMKPNKETSSYINDISEPTPEIQVHPHDQPTTNCYQLYLNIRKQIEKRRRSLFPVQPKPPQGFKDYLMNRCTYVLAGRASTTPNISYPLSLPAPMKDLFTEQEKERYKLRMQHVIEKEKLVLSVEQEILRVHGRAARALANQYLPFSVCSILRDEEVYNLITPEQEEKDRNARSRYNGRLFLSWLQDVDDKWEKIKEHMLLRHHNEAESLHAVQKMNWEWKLKELNLCDKKLTPTIDEHHVPMVHVSDDFDLLPA